MTGGTRGGLLAAHSMLRAGLLVAPVAVPAGLAIGGLLWAWRIYAVTTGLSGRTPAAPVMFDERQWRHAGTHRPRPGHRARRGASSRHGGRSLPGRRSARSGTAGGPSTPSPLPP